MTILFLLVAQVVVLGHSIIPHHHHTDLTGQPHHHQHDQDDKSQHPEDNPLALALSGFMHSGEQVTFTQADASNTVIVKQCLQVIDSLTSDFTFSAGYLLNYKKHAFPPDRHNIYHSPLHGAYSLRGPPPFIVA